MKAKHRYQTNRLIPEKAYRRYQTQRREYRYHPFLLTFEEFMEHWQKPCHYCGCEMDAIGLDRKDSNICYTAENTVPCCFNCNVMKRETPYEEFIAKIKLIASRF